MSDVPDVVKRVEEALRTDPDVFVEFREGEVLPYIVTDHSFDPPAVCARSIDADGAYEVRDKRIRLKRARAAIAAMRLPTDAMCSAGYRDDYHDWRVTADEAGRIWQDMIDEALNG